MNKAAKRQPDPKPGQKVVIVTVLQDLMARSSVGKEKYGTVLMTFNGRDPLWDAYQEALDLVMYLRQAIMEREGNPPTPISIMAMIDNHEHAVA